RTVAAAAPATVTANPAAGSHIRRTTVGSAGALSSCTNCQSCAVSATARSVHASPAAAADVARIAQSSTRSVSTAVTLATTRRVGTVAGSTTVSPSVTGSAISPGP